MHADMIILLLSMLEGNVNTTDAHSISGQMKEALVESRQVRLLPECIVYACLQRIPFLLYRYYGISKLLFLEC